MRKPIPYTPPPPKKSLIEKINLKVVLPFIIVEVFVIILAIVLTAVVSIIFSINIIISIAIMAVGLSLASYYISIKFLKKDNWYKIIPNKKYLLHLHNNHIYW